jgi:putative hemolysin
MNSPEVLSVEELQCRLPTLLPRPVAAALARRIFAALDLPRINALYASCYTCRSGAFAAAVLDYLGIRLRIRLSDEAAVALGKFRAEHRSFVVVANHPFGALDGIALLSWLTPLFPDFKLLANNLLQRVEPLQPCLLTVDPTHAGAAGTHNLSALHQAFRHVTYGGILGMFPSGHVATWHEARHPETIVWRPQVIKMLRHLDAPILPVHLKGRNTLSFYLWGLLGWRIRSLRLPHEVFAKRHAVLDLEVGAPMHAADLPQLIPTAHHTHLVRHL